MRPDCNCGKTVRRIPFVAGIRCSAPIRRDGTRNVSVVVTRVVPRNASRNVNLVIVSDRVVIGRIGRHYGNRLRPGTQVYFRLEPVAAINGRGDAGHRDVGRFAQLTGEPDRAPALGRDRRISLVGKSVSERIADLSADTVASVVVRVAGLSASVSPAAPRCRGELAQSVTIE